MPLLHIHFSFLINSEGCGSPLDQPRTGYVWELMSCSGRLSDDVMMMHQLFYYSMLIIIHNNNLMSLFFFVLCLMKSISFLRIIKLFYLQHKQIINFYMVLFIISKRNYNINSKSGLKLCSFALYFSSTDFP